MAIVAGIRGYTLYTLYFCIKIRLYLLVIDCTLFVITIICLHHENIQSNTFAAKLSLFIRIVS